MGATTLNVRTGRSASLGWCVPLVPGNGASTAFPTDASRLLPVAVSPAQAYFWTHRWRDREERAEHDRAAGRVRGFDDPTAAVRYLLDAA